MYETVFVFVEPIISRKLRSDDVEVDLWFAVIPEVL
jgi:hypothetical protein